MIHRVLLSVLLWTFGRVFPKYDRAVAIAPSEDGKAVKGMTLMVGTVEYLEEYGIKNGIFSYDEMDTDEEAED
jgi:hypothetical protein